MVLAPQPPPWSPCCTPFSSIYPPQGSQRDPAQPRPPSVPCSKSCHGSPAPSGGSSNPLHGLTGRVWPLTSLTLPLSCSWVFPPRWPPCGASDTPISGSLLCPSPYSGLSYILLITQSQLKCHSWGHVSFLHHISMSHLSFAQDDLMNVCHSPKIMSSTRQEPETLIILCLCLKGFPISFPFISPLLSFQVSAPMLPPPGSPPGHPGWDPL